MPLLTLAYLKKSPCWAERFLRTFGINEGVFLCNILIKSKNVPHVVHKVLTYACQSSCSLTFPEFIPLLGGILSLFLNNSQSGQVGPGLLSLPLQVELHVAFLWFLLLDLLSDGDNRRGVHMSKTTLFERSQGKRNTIDTNRHLPFPARQLSGSTDVYLSHLFALLRHAVGILDLDEPLHATSFPGLCAGDRKRNCQSL